MQRVMITGGPGSGKSTLARILGEQTGLPVYHMDHFHWKPGWIERASEEKIPLIREVHLQDKWIFEGGNSATFAERAARADTMIWLDLPVTLRLFRVIWRTIRDRGKVRPDMAPNCPEGFHHETWRFWTYIWATRHTARLKSKAIVENPTHLTVHHLQSRSQVTKFIANLPESKGAQP
ncbi:MAG: DNA topology modulation protein FlaR [Pseudomonadota bacterium]